MYVIIYFGLHCRGLVTTGIPEYLHILCVYGVFCWSDSVVHDVVPVLWNCVIVGLTVCGACIVKLCDCWSDSVVPVL